MGLPARIVGEGIENSKRRRPQAQREPYGRCSFLIRQRQCTFQETCDGGFLSGLRFQADQQCDFDHD
jgi:hypothetical protein